MQLVLMLGVQYHDSNDTYLSVDSLTLGVNGPLVVAVETYLSIFHSVALSISR